MYTSLAYRNDEVLTLLRYNFYHHLSCHSCQRHRRCLTRVNTKGSRAKIRHLGIGVHDTHDAVPVFPCLVHAQDQQPLSG